MKIATSVRALLLLIAAFALAAVAGSAGRATAAPAATATWKVTIENLTPATAHGPSQPLSPPLFVTHTGHVHVWQLGALASPEVAAIAEDANNAPAEQNLPSLPGIGTVATGAGGPIPSGASMTYMLQTQAPFDHLSIATMLVNTNDGFTGLDSFALTGGGAVLETAAYDAGSERNNELAAFIPGPCCNNMGVRDPTSDPIRIHPGITGVGDLSPAIYGWTDPVARITIEAIGHSGQTTGHAARKSH